MVLRPGSGRAGAGSTGAAGPDTVLARLPPDQRPRERLVTLGPGALADAELVAILLGTGRAGVGAVDLASRLLRRHGGAAGLRGVDVRALAKEPGVGPAKAARVVAALSLADRVAGGVDGRPVVRRSSDLVVVTGPRFAGARRERVVLVVCGGGGRVLDVVTVAEGGAHGAAFPVREVLAETLRRDGTAFGLVHNHPGGDPTPSAADRRATSAVRGAAAAVGLRLLDHVVVAGGRWVSVTGA